MMENVHLWPEPPPPPPPPMMEIKLIQKINLSNDGNRWTPPMMEIKLIFFGCQ